MRIAAFLLVPLFACASTEPPPKSEVVSARTVEPAPAEVQPQAQPRVDAITLKCLLGLVPASAQDGRREVERHVEVRHDFALVRIRMSGPPDRAHLPPRTPHEIARVHALALAVQAQGVPEAGPPVPDGQQCRLQLVIDSKAGIDALVDPTPPSGPLADLVLELRRWMYAPEPAWPSANDPDVAACRKASNERDIDRFHVREIVIDTDGTRRWEFLDPKERSTGNHFGCRMLKGKPHILPEG